MIVDAAERVLVRDGLDAVTTRAVAREAGINHGLVHYYHGSVDELLLAVLDRLCTRWLDWQRELLAADRPFLEAWRATLALPGADPAARAWPQLAVAAAARPALGRRLAEMRAEWHALLERSFAGAAAGYGVSPAPAAAMATLTIACIDGLRTDLLLGTDAGHRELARWLEALVTALAPPG